MNRVTIGGKMDLKLGGRTALITGASKGIGRATAEILAAEGCNLILVSRTLSDLEELRGSLKAKHNGRFEVIALDMSRSKAIDELEAVASGVDILVNNAGSMPLGGIEDVTDEQWQTAYDLKVFGYIKLTRIVHRHMRLRKAGVIINVIGHAGENFASNYVTGTSGCAALMALTKALGAASPEFGVRVVGINPGSIMTERLRNFLPIGAKRILGDETRWPELVARLPFGRAGTPEEIASAVAFLASDLSAFTTGTILTVDGGVSSKHSSWL
jgi:NAD(P)-dependent dehydrogenase (short-subunit alcohol dehydrogenase family)